MSELALDPKAVTAMAESLAEEDGELEAFEGGSFGGDPRPDTRDWFISQAMRIMTLLDRRGFRVTLTLPTTGQEGE